MNAFIILFLWVLLVLLIIQWVKTKYHGIISTKCAHKIVPIKYWCNIIMSDLNFYIHKSFDFRCLGESYTVGVLNRKLKSKFLISCLMWECSINFSEPQYCMALVCVDIIWWNMAYIYIFTCECPCLLCCIYVILYCTYMSLQK